MEQCEQCQQGGKVLFLIRSPQTRSIEQVCTSCIEDLRKVYEPE
jgi:hypothetical protein